MKAVLVTTQYRGVFFGYLDTDDAKDLPESVRLFDCRNCLSWSADMKGFLGLAANGPSSSCRVGPACDLTLYGITAIVDVSEEAEAKWKAAPWSS